MYNRVRSLPLRSLHSPGAAGQGKWPPVCLERAWLLEQSWPKESLVITKC